MSDDLTERPTTTEKSIEKSAGWFGKPKSQEEALRMINHASTVLMILAVINIFFGYQRLGIAGAIGGAILGVLGLLLRQFKSPAIAVLTLIFSSLSLLGTLYFLIQKQPLGGNLVIGAAFVIMSIQALRATSFYQQQKKDPSPIQT